MEEANDNKDVLGRPLDFLLPLVLADLDAGPEPGLRCLCLHLLQPLLAVLPHELIVIEVRVLFSHLLELLVVQDPLAVVELEHISGL